MTASNKWVSSDIKHNASKIEIDDRIEYIVSNALQAIPEHKFEGIYFYVFNEAFKPSLFGAAYKNMTEIIASKPTLYRKISNDGRAFIHCSHRKPSSSSTDDYYVPKWNVFANTKHSIYARKSVILKVYKNEQYASNIDLVDLLLTPLSKAKVYLVFGRDEHECDFCVQHLSISRKHCIFYFNRNGQVYLFDISTHGVLINERPAPKRKHVQLNHDDRIKFGQSSRCYVVCVGDKPPIAPEQKENMVATAGANQLKKSEREKQKLQLENAKQSDKISEMAKMIEKLTLQLKQSEEHENVQSEDEKQEDDGGKKVKQQEDKNRKDPDHDDSENENESASASEPDADGDGDEEDDTDGQEEEDGDEEDSEDQEEVKKVAKRVTTINGVDFLKERDNLSKLTVFKLRYYVDKNNINAGRLKKAELINVVKNDIKKHFGA